VLESFVFADGELDQATWGPVWLAHQRVAHMIIEALHYGERVRRFYDLYAYVVMPNHVHVVWKPRLSLPRILQWLKGVTAKRGKSLLGLGVKHFWQDDLMTTGSALKESYRRLSAMWSGIR
jgi:REP element-mobilizing transposase RayT